VEKFSTQHCSKINDQRTYTSLQNFIRQNIWRLRYNSQLRHILRADVLI